MLRDIIKTVDLSLENKPFESKVVIFEDIIEQKEFANWLLKVEDDQIPTIDRSAKYQYPIEYLNSITIGELLPHKLKNVIEAEIITGRHAGKHAFLPHVILSPTNATLPFTFKHCQFPIQPTFVINHRVRH
ncbi:ATP-dependent DNA helicase PIF1-like [Rhizophagus irregularis DAOM 181602=DAOM 197198]|nr:ATP-dependent DNA helicase PIF1-like [Rhizophagus irregularis DAOM 181602=DAOM 197198]